jgi:methyl-accepting chemotaxis protein
LVDGLKGEPDIAYVIILDVHGIAWAHSDPEFVGKPLKDDVTQKDLTYTESTVTTIRLPNGQSAYDVVFPVLMQGGAIELLGEEEGSQQAERVGLVRLGLSHEGLKNKLNRILLYSVMLTTTIVAIGLAISLFLVRWVVVPVERMAQVAVRIADGDFTQQVQVGSRDEVGVLGSSFGKMSSDLSGMLKSVQGVVSQLGGISERITGHSAKVFNGAQIQADATEKTSSSIEEMNASIKEIAENIEALSSSAEETSSSILEMSSSIGEVANNSAGLAGSVDETSSSIMEMSASIKQVAENVEILSSAAEETASAVTQINTTLREVESHAKESARLSERVMSDAQELGMRSIDKTIEGMTKIRETVVKSADVINRLGDRSEQVGKILTVIDEVTRQTNLLALNAAILAAQAGEQGKGFAVVADEIKNLADRTASSTREIAQLILTVQSEAKEAVESIRDGSRSVEDGMRLANEAGQALRKILDSSSSSVNMSREIERATMEQARGTRQVTEAMQRVSAMVQQIVRATQEQSRGSAQIIQAAEKMRDLTRQVKLSTEEQAKGSRQITQAVGGVTERAQQMAKAINEQKKGSEIIMRSVGEIRAIAQDSVRLAEQMRQEVESLTQQAALIKREMSRFRVV